MNIPIRPLSDQKRERGTVRVTLLMMPAEKKILFAKAAKEGCSASEYLRRKAFENDPDLDAMAAGIQASMVHAVDSVDRFLSLMETRAQGATEQSAKVRANAAREVASWTPEQRNAVNVLFSAG